MDMSRDVRAELDAFYTPDDLARHLVGLLPVLPGDTVLEPSVGGGAFARALKRQEVTGIDLDPRARGFDHCDYSEVGDFLAVEKESFDRAPRWVVGNPPYSHAQAHVEHALAITGQHVCFLLRLAFLESAKRIQFWRQHPARCVWVLSERPSFTGKGTDSAAYGFFWFDKFWEGSTELRITSWKSA